MNLSVLKKLLIFVLLAMVSNAFALPNRLIKNVTLSKENGLDVVTVKLSVPMSYTHHFPKTESRTVIINLRAFSSDSKIVLASSNEEKYRIPRKRSRLVSYLRVESLDNNVGKLAVQFKKKVSFTVKQINKKTLKIVIGGKSKAKSSKAKTKAIIAKKKKPKSVKVKPRKSSKSKKSKKTKSSSKNELIYVLNLESYQKGKKPRKIPKLDIFRKYKLFRTRVKKKNVLVTRLRLGFFRSKTEAERIKRRIKVYYPNTFLTLMQKNESSLSRKWFAKKKIIPTKVTKSAKATKKKSTKALSKKQLSKVDQLFSKGRLALIEKRFRSAISLFTKVSEIASGEKKQQALEYIGLAREKNGQIAHAKAEYKKYLKLYPEGPGSERVKQRLEGLLTAQLAPKIKLKDKSKGRRKEKQEWEYFSTISESYRNSKSVRDDQGASTTDNSINSYFNTSGRKRGDKYDLKFQFDMDHRYDFIEAKKPNGRASDYGLSSAYFDYISLTGLGTLRIGRQSRSSGGVLGRFDGLWYGYPYSNDIKINFIAGLPVRSTAGIQVTGDQQVVGVSADFDKIYKNIGVSTFLIQQNNGGILDRRAVGAEMRYFANGNSYFGLLDYDISYNILNTIQVVGSWSFKGNHSISMVLDQRASPLISSSNALQGQTLSRLKEMVDLISEQQIRDMAIARTSTYQSVSLSGNYQISGNYSVSANLNYSKSGATEATPGLLPKPKINPTDAQTYEINPVPANAAQSPSLFYGATFIASNLFTKRDTNIFGLRQSSASNGNSTGFDARSQFNLNKKWRMRPRIRYDIRQTKSNGTRTTRVGLSFRVDYRYTRDLQFQLEVGRESSRSQFENGEVGTDLNDSIDLSYIWDF